MKIGDRKRTLICLLFIYIVHLWTGESSSRWYIFKVQVKDHKSCFKYNSDIKGSCFVLIHFHKTEVSVEPRSFAMT